jgi:hypothetical protein
MKIYIVPRFHIIENFLGFSVSGQFDDVEDIRTVTVWAIFINVSLSVTFGVRKNAS